MRVLRVYHGGRDPAHRLRERSLNLTGLELTVVVPNRWPGGGTQDQLSEEPFRTVELAVIRPGDVNRHRYADPKAVAALFREVRPDVLDLHEEPFSLVGRQWLEAAPPDVSVVMYTAQNVDKRYPPPFSGYERRAFRGVAALYPCSRQAAAVARGKGFRGVIDVIPLGYSPELFAPGEQRPDDEELLLALFGRLVPEKGALDAVHVLSRLVKARPARLALVGSGPEGQAALDLARTLGVGDRLELQSWRATEEVAELYRRAHFVLVPSIPTATWTEQFGRVIVEAHATGAVVAGYATGSIPEVAGDAAALVPTGDVRALADVVVRLAEDGEEWRRLRESGFELAADRTWPAVASRQADLYRRVASGPEDQLKLERSPRSRRTAARTEFAPTAPTTAGLRPFAVPILRRGGAIPAALASIIDGVAELGARFGVDVQR